MTPRPDLNKLAKEVFEANKLKGFHDTEESNEHWLALVITELSEAIEADRKGKRADLDTYNTHITYVHFEHKKTSEFKDREKWFFEECIKDSLEDELADAIIRLLDLAGLRGWDIDWKGIVYYKHFHKKPLTVSIYEGIALLYNHILSEHGKTERLIAYIEALAYSLNIDIWQYVSLKIKYNSTRERLHGKKY